MPVRSHIRGLSEKRSLPVLGKLRLGTKEKNRNACKDHQRTGPQIDCQRCTHPVMLDYFATDDTPAGRQFREIFGDTPRSLPIEFPVDDEAIVAAHNLELWGDGLMRCRGDGYTANALVVPGVHANWQRQAEQSPDVPPPEGMWARSGFSPQGQPDPQRVDIPCLGEGYDGKPACPMFGGRGCGPSMHLKFVVRGYPALGVWQLDTGSVMSIERVLSYLALLREWRGSINRVPLLLSLSTTSVRGRDFYPLRFDVDLPREQMTALLAGRPPITADGPDLIGDAAPDVDALDAAFVDDVPAVDVHEDVPLADPVADRPFEVDDRPRAEQLLEWARETHKMPAALVFNVLGVRDLAGIVLMGIPEAQNKIEAAAEESIAIEGTFVDEPPVPAAAPTGVEIPPMPRGRGDLFAWGLKQPQRFSPADFVRMSGSEDVQAAESVVDLDRVAAEMHGFENLARHVLAQRSAVTA